MNRRYTGREVRQVLFEVLRNAYLHLEEITKEISKLNLKRKEDIEKLSPEDHEKFQSLTLIYTIMNDIIHPAHDVSLELFQGEGVKAMLEFCRNAQRAAFKEKIVEVCVCMSCKREERENKTTPSTTKK